MSDGLTDRRSESTYKCQSCKEDKYMDDFYNFGDRLCYACFHAKEAEKKKGIKFDDGKLRYDLIPPEVLLWLAELYTHGAKKYAPDNWKGVELERYIAAFERHFNAWRLGEDIDEESKFHHLKHAMWNAATICWLELNKPKG